jgi:hypothetical protein
LVGAWPIGGRRPFWSVFSSIPPFLSAEESAALRHYSKRCANIIQQSTCQNVL